MDPEKVRALSNFYREEFQKHLDHLEASGIGPETAERTCRRFLDELEQLCWRSDFPRVAETLLQSFDTLTRLSQQNPPRGH